MVRPVTDEDTGIRVLCEPCDEAISQAQIIDIVAIHGIGAHPDDTWCRLSSSSAEEEKQYVNWLQDKTMLPSLAPRARILRYGYESQWFGPNAISQTTTRIAERFLLALKRQRKEYPFRPLIVIAHCFGGLVTLKALLTAYRNEQDWTGLFQSTVGLVFFGTPFRGAEGMSQVDMIEAALSEYGAQEVHEGVLQILNPGNEMLQGLVDDFSKTRSLPHRALVACFYELKPSDVGAIVGKQKRNRYVVSESSGCLDLSEATEKYSLSRSHFNMNKFGKPSEEDFLTVRDVVERMVNEASDIILARSQYIGNFKVQFNTDDLPLTDHFVGRESYLNEVEAYFSPTTMSAKNRRLYVMYGLGGIGKTQIAVEYVRRHHKKYSAVLWLDGSSEDRLRQSFESFARRLNDNQVTPDLKRSLADPHPDLDVVVKAVRQWLSSPSNDRWLLVFDNVDRDYQSSARDVQAYDIKRYLSHADHGSVLVTSRLHNLKQRFKYGKEIVKVDDIEAKAILQSRAGCPIESVDSIIELLHGLPLALTQTGAYIGLTQMSTSRYIDNYKRTWDKLMSKQDRFLLQEYNERSVLATWLISYNQIKKESEVAGQLLKLWSCFSNGDLWYELLAGICCKEDARSFCPLWLRTLTESELDFDDIIGLLRNYSLIESRDQCRVTSMHAVLHEWTFSICNNDEKTAMSRLAMAIVANGVPLDEDQDCWHVWNRLLPHGRRAIERYQMSLSGMENETTVKSLHRLGDLFAALILFTQAEELYAEALTGSEKVLGLDHRSTLDIAHDLGVLYVKQGQLGKAESMCQRALEGKEKILEADHLSVLVTINGLGIIREKQGKLDEAERMYLRALVGKEKRLGQHDPITLNTLDNLGYLYRTQGRLSEAENLLDRALKGNENALGADHHSTLATMNNLGNVYSDQGKLVEAETMYQRTLMHKERTLGSDHVSTLETVNNLGILYNDQAKLVEAERLYRRALLGFEKALGSNHPVVSTTSHNLGINCWRQGKLNEAEFFLLRGLIGREKTPGPDHESTSRTRAYLANVYRDLNRPHDADKLYERDG